MPSTKRRSESASKTTTTTEPAKGAGKTPASGAAGSGGAKGGAKGKSGAGGKKKTAAKRTRSLEELSAAELDQLEVKVIWKQFISSPSHHLRNYFLERYLPLVRYNAERIYARLPDEVDIEDLVQAGFYGLRDAVNAFDLDRGVKFETYCAPRIRGAILDELRTMDWVPRLVRSRTAKVDGARNALEMKLGRKPTQQEIAEHLGVDGEEYKKIHRDGSPVGVVSLSRNWNRSDGNRELREIDVIQDRRQVNPLNETQRRDLKDLITKGLSRAERLIVVLYYYEEMTMKEIGATLDLSESRVSQMHSSILARLKAQMQHREREFEAQAVF